MRYYRVGAVVIMQNQGVPIGGPIPGAVLDVGLSDLEHFFGTYIWKRVCEQLGITGSRETYIASGRYADDSIFISRWFCKKCPAAMLLSVYRSQVAFGISTEDSTHEDTVAIKFLDVWYNVHWNRISPAAHILNERACWFRDIQLCKKHRRASKLHHEGAIQSIKIALRRDLFGKLSRARQLSLSPFSSKYFVATLFQEILLIVYPLQVLKQAWHSLGLHDAFHNYDNQVIRLMHKQRFQKSFGDLVVAIAHHEYKYSARQEDKSDLAHTLNRVDVIFQEHQKENDEALLEMIKELVRAEDTRIRAVQERAIIGSWLLHLSLEGRNG